MTDEIIFYIAQAVGFLAVILAFIMFQLKTQRSVLWAQTVICVIMAVHYFLLGAYVATAMNICGIIRCFVYFKTSDSNKKIYPILMSLMTLAAGIFSWDGARSLFIMTGLVINTYCLSFKDPQHLRYSILFTSPLILIYDILTFSVGGIILDVVTITSAVIGIFRFREAKRK